MSLSTEDFASPKRRPRKIRSAAKQKELARNIAEMYRGQEKVGMERLERVRPDYGRRIMLGLIAFFVTLSAVTLAGFFLFSPTKKPFTGEAIAAAIEGPIEAKSGQPLEYSLRVRNGESDSLGTASVTLRLPGEFRRDEAGAGDILLGAIGPGEEREVSIDGRFLAPLGKTYDLQAVLTYRPAAMQSEFQKVATLPVTISGSAIELTATGPDKAFPGDPLTYVIVAKNTADVPVERIVVAPKIPASFLIDSAAPAFADPTLSRWTIATLAPGAETTLRFSGAFTSGAKGPAAVGATASLSDDSRGLLLQSEATAPIEVREGDLAVSVVLNSATANAVIGFGDSLRYAISYRNAGQSTFEDVTVSATFTPSPAGAELLRWNELKDTRAGVRKGNKLTWTKKQIPGLAKVKPGDEGVVDFTIPAIAGPDGKIAGSAYSVSIIAETSVAKINGEKSSRSTKTAPLLASFRSDTVIVAESRYYSDEGAPLGSGPLPPVRGQKTTYRLEWHVSNAFHELENLKMEATLPPNVEWAERSDASAGSVAYDRKTRKVTWTLNWLPLSVKGADISFDVAITPTEAQKGAIPPLLSATGFSAVDKTLGQPFALAAPEVTTATVNDDLASGKGKVQ